MFSSWCEIGCSREKVSLEMSTFRSVMDFLRSRRSVFVRGSELFSAVSPLAAILSSDKCNEEARIFDFPEIRNDFKAC